MIQLATPDELRGRVSAVNMVFVGASNELGEFRAGSIGEWMGPVGATVAGGIGTLEELFETWTAGYLGMHDKPVVLLDPDGHYDGLLAWLDGLRDGGYVAQVALDRLLTVRDVDAALDLCAPALDTTDASGTSGTAHR